LLSGVKWSFSSADFAWSLSSVFGGPLFQGKEQAAAMEKRRITIVLARLIFIADSLSYLIVFLDGEIKEFRID